MRKSILRSPLLSLLLAASLFASVSSFRAPTAGLILSSPGSCPSGGCAAGQRINFLVEFPLLADYPSGDNTQVCIYGPEDGQSGSGSTPWADAARAQVYSPGRFTGTTYTSGETGSLCTNNTDSGDLWITGAYGTNPNPTDEQIEFVLNIHKQSDRNGTITVKIFQRDSGGSSWSETDAFTQTIPVAPRTSTVFVARETAACENFTPCYVNSGDDGPDGQGTGLRDAILALEPDAKIWILSDYAIKSHAVTIDQPLIIAGYETALITYLGSTCNAPMLSITAGATLQNLTLNDGNCDAANSRTLVEVDSPAHVILKHNTLMYGQEGVLVKDNAGNVTITASQIANNLDYAVLREPGNSGGNVILTANNIINNRSGYQVNCNYHGSADHNFWGESRLASNSAMNCITVNGKMLGAPILLSNDGAGVEAIRTTVTGSKTYHFNGKISLHHTAGSDYDVYLVNHGAGTDDNIPFLDAGAGPLEACSNFYDVFLAEGAAASDLILSLKYDRNSACVDRIESAAYCAGGASADYPLWWFDPAGAVTDQWDRTGQAPQGAGAGGASGQTTTCQMNINEISVTIDNTGRPGLSTDLNYTPFAAGLPISPGVTLTQFTAVFDVTENDLRWITSRETGVAGFHLLRAEAETGPYVRITPRIEAIGDTSIGGIYNHTDTDIEFTRTYFYKLEVVDDQGNTIQIHGLVSVLTSTATPTPTLTHTPTLTRTATITPTPRNTRTATPYYYRSPTSYYRPATSTPRTGPTQVRTYGATETPDSTRRTATTTPTGPTPTGKTPTPRETGTEDPESAYPVKTSPTDFFETSQAGEVSGEEEEKGGRGSTSTPDVTRTPAAESTTPEGQENDRETPSDSSGSGDNNGEMETVPWAYLLLGSIAGLGILWTGGYILLRAKSP